MRRRKNLIRKNGDVYNTRRLLDRDRILVCNRQKAKREWVFREYVARVCCRPNGDPVTTVRMWNGYAVERSRGRMKGLDIIAWHCMISRRFHLSDADGRAWAKAVLAAEGRVIRT